MHDVIIDDTKSSFAAVNSVQRERKPQKKRSFSGYLVDWVEKALIIACLISIDFLAFAGAGSYQMFDHSTFLTLEVWYIIAGIFAASVLLMYILSFSSFFQNVTVSVVVALFITVMLNQFAAFDKNSMLASLVATYVSHDIGLLFNYVSHIILSVFIGFLFFLFVSFASKKLIAWFVLFLMVIMIAVTFGQFSSRNENVKYNVVREDVKTIGDKPGKRFIFIGMPTVGSYNYLNDIIQEQKTVNKAEAESLRKSLDIMLGFYANNGFIMYPHSYVNELDANNNWGQILNINNPKNAFEYTQKNISVDKFWKFNYLSPKYLFLKENKLYDTFKKAKFGVNAYQNGGVEMCKVNNETAVNRCVEKNGKPIDFDGMNLSLEQKIEVLAAQWVESWGIFENFSYLYSLLRPFVDVETFPVVGISYKNIDIKNSLDVLDRLAKDVESDTGDKAYFVNLNMPGDTFIYDEFCRIKPIEKWQNKIDQPWVRKISDKDKRKAYAEQLRCVYGSLQKFMDRLQQSETGKKSVVVIQGMSGINGMVPLTEKGFLKEIKNKKYVDMAIKDPLKGDFKVAHDICSAPNILKQYLYRKGKCPELKEFNLHVDAARDFANSLHSLTFDDALVEAAKKNYISWYQDWQKAQPGSILKAGALLPQKTEEDKSKAVASEEAPADVVADEAKKEETAPEKTADAVKEAVVPETDEAIADVLPEKEIGEVKTMPHPVEELAEAPVEKLPAKVEADKAVEAKPLPQLREETPEAVNDNIPLENTAKAE